MSASYVALARAVLTAATLSPNPTSIQPAPLSPSAVFPALTIQTPVASELESLGGLSGMQDTYLQFNCCSPNYDEAFALREAVQTALIAGVGAVPGYSPSRLESVSEFRKTELWMSNPQYYQLILRVHMWWS